MEFKDKLLDLYIKRMEAQRKHDEAYSELRDIKEEEKELYKAIFKKIRMSNGELTIEKLLNEHWQYTKSMI